MRFIHAKRIQTRRFLLAAGAAAGLLALGSGLAFAQRSAGAGTRAITSAEAAQSPVGVTAQTPARAQNPATAGAITAPATPAPQKTTLADFAWLGGRWLGAWGPRSAEQCWSAPKAGMMLGTFRLVENEKTLVIEMFTLVEKPDAISFYFRHFTPDLVPWEKTDATELHLISLDGTRTTFENPVNGQPKHSIFTRIDADTFVSRSEIVPDSGETQIVEITYHRQKPAAPPAVSGKSSGGSAARR
jgi:Domain of unknown function (DUF6265)